MRRTILAVAWLTVLSTAAQAQGETSLASLLSGKTAMALKDIGSSFRRLTITGVSAGGGMDLSQLAMLGALSDKSGKGGKGGPAEAMGAMIGMSLLGSMFGGGSGLTGGNGETILYTEGAVVQIGGESFLVAYRYKKPSMNLMQMAMESTGQGGKEPDSAKAASEGKMTADSLLTLTLVNLRSIATLSDIRPFDLQRELAEAQQGGGLMDLIASSMKEEAAPPKPAPKPKPAAGAKPRPR